MNNSPSQDLTYSDDVIPSIDLERFSNDCRQTKTKVITLTNHNRNGTNSAMNQSEFLAITCNSLEAREKSRVRGAIGFGFASHWLKNWRDSFKPITKRSKRNHVITFDSHLKTALTVVNIIPIFKHHPCLFCSDYLVRIVEDGLQPALIPAAVQDRIWLDCSLSKVTIVTRNLLNLF